MIIREVLPAERNSYNDAVSHILQSYEWGVFREATGVKVVRMGVFEGRFVSGFQLTIHPIPYTSYNVGYCPRGPELTEELLDHLTKIGLENNCVFIKIEPDIDKSKIKNQKSKIQAENIISSIPVLPKYTFHVDLTASEEEILGRMKEKTRYNIRLAQKQEVVVEEKNDHESLELFIHLLSETAKRQGFFNHPADYYRNLWSVLKPSNMCYLLIAHFNDTPMAAILLLRFKDVLYYPYGGSSTLYREKMPNHLLHWEAIRLGKRLGCTTYDMWGAYKETPTEKDPWYGIYRFKEGFGGKLVDYPQTFDLIFEPKLYKIYKFIDPLRFKLLSLKRMLRI